jgi:ornithine cyclodeaminase/alanine dehydrogenase-like protein (mu-crystallin family)
MRYLTDAEVERLLPSPAEAVRLAHDALVALARGDAEVPPKPAVHGPGGAFANAMPAAYRSRNLLGCKWISIFPDNQAHGLPTASGLMVVNDGATGVPRCVMAAGALTAARTAAVSGACVAALVQPGAPAAITGAGVQARSHLRVLAALGHRDVSVYARRTQAREAVTAWAAEHVPSVELSATDSVAEAVDGAKVVVTALSIGLSGAQLDPASLADDVLLLPLDYASSVGPDLAAAATLAADHVTQFEAVRMARTLGDYPAASMWTGELLEGPGPAGRVVCQNLGNGLSDLVVAAAVADAAATQDAGQVMGS